MKSQKKGKLKKNEISKKLNLKKRKKEKKMKIKHSQNSKISELNQCQCQTKTVPEYVRIQVMSESDNVRVR